MAGLAKEGMSLCWMEFCSCGFLHCSPGPGSEVRGERGVSQTLHPLFFGEGVQISGLAFFVCEHVSNMIKYLSNESFAG